ncbi:g5891 [Coccomyxa viridis]|uniref:G5891 protein n=1 Tax=Coccomyxa viridis TaxID=1274662 RepID=A0ABP1FU17_9CHLO
MQKNLDAKHDKILKSLLRLPDNRRCAVCDTLGPQYVVVDFSMFVCTICCGIHRQFNHRCKGISMASFKPEEIRALENGGNGVALATYLAKWNPRDAPKPIDRNIGKVRDWIDLVFVKKRFYSSEAVFAAPPPPVSRTQSVSSARSTASRENDFVFKAAAGGYSNGNSAFQASANEPRGGTSDAGSLIDLELTPSAPAGAVPSGFPEADPVASTSAARSPGAPAPAAGEAQPSGWAAFEEPQAQAAQAAAPPAVPPAPHNQTAAVPQEQPKAEAFSGWQAFDSQPAQPQQASPASAAAAAGAGSQAGVMKELPSDLFSELAAPPPQRQAPQPPPYMQQPGYGQMGQLYGQQAGVGQGAAFPGAPAGVFPYPYAQPVPPGYQPFILANPAAAMPQQQQLQSFPPSGIETLQEPATHDVFSGLVPGLKSSLPAIPNAPAPNTSPPQATYSNGGMQQSQTQSQYGQFGQPFGGLGLQNGEDLHLQAAQQPYMGSYAGSQASPLQPKKGGNPFA